MKALILLLVLLSTLSFGQTLPVVVDNSKWFPPAGVQYWNSCGPYSLAILKTYIWNRHYGRDTELPENQFSPYCVWNLNVSPVFNGISQNDAFYSMKEQGVVTVKDFNFAGESEEIMPSLKARENALSFRSKSYNEISLGVHSILQAQEYIKELKDSLNKGICFSLHFPLFKSIDKLYEPNQSVYSYENNLETDMYASHIATVVGYNDTIKTKSGRGAFKILNSWGKVFGEDGYFYLDYNWFNMPRMGFACYFLEEDFDHRAELCLSLELTQSISGEDIDNRKYLFVDVLKNIQGKNLDFIDWNAYSAGRNIVSVKSINKKKIDVSNEIIYINNHDHIGSHSMMSDLTDYIKSSDFQSLELIVNDPVSATYVGQDDQIIYSFVREAKSQIANQRIKFLNTDKIIIGKVIDLPDTTISVNDFYSRVAGVYLTPQVWEEIYVKSCTSVLKRKLVTFSIAEIQSDVTPVIVNPGTLYANTNKTFTYQFEAGDSNNNPITFSLLTSLPEAQLTSDGKLSFKSDKVNIYKFTVVATNGYSSVSLLVTVRVNFETGAASARKSDYSIIAYPNLVVNNLNIELLMKNAGSVNLTLYDLQGRQVDIVAQGEYLVGKNTINYNASHLRSGTYVCRFKTDGFNQSIKIIKK